jgi:predicted nucleic acid-binding protein
MMKVFLDTNILLDFGLDRERADFVGGILQLGKDGLIELYASYLSYANMGYILRDRPTPERYELVRMMRQPVVVLLCDANQLDAGLNTEVKDFEDMLQYQCAKAAGCDYIVTNDRRHYDFSDIPHLSSADFVEQLDEFIK